MTLNEFETELKSKDEFAYFKEAVFVLKDRDIEFLHSLVVELPEKKKDYLKEVLQSQRIQSSATGTSLARKVVKVGGRKLARVTEEDGEVKQAPPQ